MGEVMFKKYTEVLCSHYAIYTVRKSPHKHDFVLSLDWIEAGGQRWICCDGSRLWRRHWHGEVLQHEMPGTVLSIYCIPPLDPHRVTRAWPFQLPRVYVLGLFHLQCLIPGCRKFHDRTIRVS